VVDLAALPDVLNAIARDKTANTLFFAFTPAALSRDGRCNRRRPVGYLKSLWVDSG
jgi:hypothetical protein